MNHWHSQRYLAAGLAQQLDKTLLQRAIKTAEVTQATNPRVPVLFTLRHLAHETDVPYMYLRKVIARDEAVAPYRVFSLKKRKGIGQGKRYRVICAPEPLLLRAQRWIHDNILKQASAHSASVAYAGGSRILDAAATHCAAKWLIKLDVSNFFESILEPSIYKVFRKFGYQPLIAFELTRLCTRLRENGNMAKLGADIHFRIKYYDNAFIGHLPQGAPTSPLLANLASHDLDTAIALIAARYQLRYTRYADDITLSTKSDAFSRADAATVIHACYAEMQARGLWPNRTKTTIVPPGARKIVLGLLVDGERPRLSREFKERLRMHIHFLQNERIGPVRHAVKRGFDSVLGLQHHLLGLVAFAIGIEADWGTARMRELNAIDWPTALEFPP